MAVPLQLLFLWLLHRFDRALLSADPAERADERQTNRRLALFSAAFLAVTILTRAKHDYAHHVEVWDAVLRGDIPWYVKGTWGLVNVYGPLFNVLALPRGLNLLGPKLLYAFAYAVFVAWLIKGCARPDERGALPRTALIGCLLNPLPWLETAYAGHFDVLVGLCCVAAVHAQRCGRDVRAGVYVGVGVLLKFLPLVLLPFLGLERRQVRVRLFASATLTIVAGFAASVLIWGKATFLALWILSLQPNQLSVFRFLWGDWSPLRPWLSRAEVQAIATPVLAIGGGIVFVAYWLSRIAAPTGAVMAILTTLLLYKASFLGYQMVLFTLAWYWYLTFPDRDWLARDRLSTVAFIAYFGWVGLFGAFMYGVGPREYFLGRWAWMEDVVGLPTFLLGLLLFGALWRASRREAEIGALQGVSPDPMGS
jgi:hypothetical protein